MEQLFSSASPPRPPPITSFSFLSFALSWKWAALVARRITKGNCFSSLCRIVEACLLVNALLGQKKKISVAHCLKNKASTYILHTYIFKVRRLQWSCEVSFLWKLNFNGPQTAAVWLDWLMSHYSLFGSLTDSLYKHHNLSLLLCHSLLL